jgi:glycosyltransferase involved in cell wall biosynthesis
MGKTKVAFLGPQYGVGGAGQVCADVGKALGRRGYDVDFLVCGAYSEDSYLEENLPRRCSVVPFTDVAPKNDDKIHNLRYYGAQFQSLLGYLRDQEQVSLLSNATKYNILSVWASALCGRSVDLFLIEHNMLRPRISGSRHVLPLLVRTNYPFANRVIGVSDDITVEFISEYGLCERLCITIRNPVDADKITRQAEEPLTHPWFSDDPPVILGVGRFERFKQFSVLLSAFKELTRGIDARLVLLGDGSRKQKLIRQAESSEVEDDVDFVGFVSNPYKYMRRADLLAHSSRYEGFGLVLVEALACGTPVVATNCPGGPSDILNDGEYGELVDVGDPRGLSDAMARTLDDPPDPDRLVRRAQHYRVEKVADRYVEVIEWATK